MVKNLPACRRLGFDPWVRKIPWRMDWLSTPVFLPGEFHGQRSLVGHSPQGHNIVGHNLATERQQAKNPKRCICVSTFLTANLAIFTESGPTFAAIRALQGGNPVQAWDLLPNLGGWLIRVR